MQQTDGVESVWIKTGVVTEDSGDDHQTIQTASNTQQISSTYGNIRQQAKKSEHTDNQPVSVIGEQRLSRASKRRSSQKDIAAAEFTVSTIRHSKVTGNVHRNKQKHKCPHCSASYRYICKLNIHIRSHTGAKPFECKVCSKTFHEARKLRAHEQYHNKDQLKCPHCSRKFTKQSRLKDHIRTHTGEKPFMCKVCGKTFHWVANLRTHMQIHNKDQHKCPHCPYKFAKQSSLKDHIRTHTGEKPFMCKICGKTFHAARYLTLHMQIHDKDQHKCPHCPGKFALKSQLKDHIRTHTGAKPFMCKVCGKTFHTADILRTHMQIHPFDARREASEATQSTNATQNVHENKKKHQCPHCSTAYAKEYLLKIHMRSHTGEKPFMCQVCSKTFYAARYLLRHMDVHNKDQNQCPQCSRKFARKSSLVEHIRTHTGEKPFTCKVCDKAFHTTNNLRLHMNNHVNGSTAVPQYQCPYCRGKFKLHSQLKNHIRTHTGEKPFVCKVCSKAFHSAAKLSVHKNIHNKDQNQCPHCPGQFALQRQLKDHIRTHTGEKPFLCTVCGKAFHAAANLRSHMQSHDKDFVAARAERRRQEIKIAKQKQRKYNEQQRKKRQIANQTIRDRTTNIVVAARPERARQTINSTK
ncbi:zinc finger protein 431-like [Anopheles cruzii]|uniref:zinc finger protein 431-like n=1 Tax=Anopheles cruzii TaxID=68878 RepID=UPI0022EC9438|nr:zinc finger protein 431-like [Anopheles cruzii]